MEEKPKLLFQGPDGLNPPQRILLLPKSDIRAAGDVCRFLPHPAWNAFKRHALPDTTQEAWRRTDIHTLPVDKFKLAGRWRSQIFPPCAKIC